MSVKPPFNVYIGWDSREAVAADVCSHSIRKRTSVPLNISYLKHRELRKRNIFSRPWLINAVTGNFHDLIDDRPFSTEFSHTRFLVPKLMNYTGWALFMDSDMLFLSDIKKLYDLCDDKYAVMCVKHNHLPTIGSHKMDDREQLRYHRKNWSSFVLWNCGHPANKAITPEKVSYMSGAHLHSFGWLIDEQIGALPVTYNYISGASPSLGQGKMPDVIHYTDGGPWFDNCKDVAYGGKWLEEYEDYQTSAQAVSDVPCMAFDKEGR